MDDCRPCCISKFDNFASYFTYLYYIFSLKKGKLTSFLNSTQDINLAAKCLARETNKFLCKVDTSRETKSRDTNKLDQRNFFYVTLHF